MVSAGFPFVLEFGLEDRDIPTSGFYCTASRTPKASETPSSLQVLWFVFGFGEINDLIVDMVVAGSHATREPSPEPMRPVMEEPGECFEYVLGLLGSYQQRVPVWEPCSLWFPTIWGIEERRPSGVESVCQTWA